MRETQGNGSHGKLCKWCDRACWAASDAVGHRGSTRSGLTERDWMMMNPFVYKSRGEGHLERRKECVYTHKGKDHKMQRFRVPWKSGTRQETVGRRQGGEEQGLWWHLKGPWGAAHHSCSPNISQSTLWRMQGCKVITENQVTRKPAATYLCDQPLWFTHSCTVHASRHFPYHNCSKTNLDPFHTCEYLWPWGGSLGMPSIHHSSPGSTFFSWDNKQTCMSLSQKPSPLWPGQGLLLWLLPIFLPAALSDGDWLLFTFVRGQSSCPVWLLSLSTALHPRPRN